MKQLSFTDWLHALKHASSFDLYRLRVLIDDELDSPVRQRLLFASLRVGQELHYFDAQTHQQHPCRILEILQKYVVVLDLAEQRRYKILPHMLNLSGQSVDVVLPQGQKLERHHLKTGDHVAFIATDGGYIEGCIIRLNQKSVTLRATDNKQWRVGYGLLQRPIIDLKPDE
ncbi:hypothetical protein IVG45_15445 [Methylomonas sp. LL1]|uniref:hypothetical protein n=1 Tax=Methylomonas sp. LL1 TaxID=2785785 RepID=UPI0018C37F1F|nr:hypothetical protein [Methylomonas sp. LL1]QPK62236.1 hypothetical protein IVG45_15445 [Methylomonas sp. LL1]